MVGRRFMLDTNTVSAVVVRRPRAVHERLNATPIAQVCVSVITEAELRFGLERRPAAVRLARDVEDFLMRVEILPWTSTVVASYSRLRATLEFRGSPLGALDTLIAAHAVAEEAVMVTHDGAFARVPGLTVEDWLIA